MTDLLEDVKRIVRSVWLDGPTAPTDVELRPETRFVEDLVIDSLAAIEMVIEAEEVFGIEIPDGEYDDVRTVQDAVNYVRRKLENVPGKEEDRP